MASYRIVTLRNPNGQLFTEKVYNADYFGASQAAMNRNPGCTVVSAHQLGSDNGGGISSGASIFSGLGGFIFLMIFVTFLVILAA